MPRYELSKDSKYYLPKETYQMVQHYCRQYRTKRKLTNGGKRISLQRAG